MTTRSVVNSFVRRAALAALVAVPAASWTEAGPRANASPTPAPPPRTSEYVEVVATRVPEPPEDVAASLEVFTGDELRERGVRDLADALALATGVRIAPGGDSGPATSVPEFWGLREFDAFLLVVDGVPLGGAFNPDLGALDLGDVERVEVLRGPAPVPFGATSFVGVIHVVHRQSTEMLRSVSGGFGSHASGLGRLEAGAPSWLGFSSRLSAGFERRGFKDDRTSFRRGHALWRNSRSLGAGRLRLDAEGVLLDQEPASPHPRAGATLSPLVPLDANYNPADAFLNERRFAFNTGYERVIRAASWSTSLSFSHVSRSAFRGFLQDISDPAPARGFRQNIEGNDLYFDTHLAGPAGRWRWVVGADHLHGEADSKGAVFDYLVGLSGTRPPAVSEPSVLSLGSGDRRDFSGLYGMTEWTPARAWRLEAGLRLNRTAEKREGEAGEEQRPAGAEEEGAEREDVRLSSNVGLTFTAWERGHDRVRLFAAYRNTFKPAAIDFGLGEAEGEEERLLEPETAQTYEVGAKTRLFGGRASLEVSGFTMDFHNLVVATIVNGLPALTNAGQERFRGVEGGLSWHFTQDVTGRASYSFHDAKFVDFVMDFDGVATQLAGKRLELSARHLFSAGLTYARAQGPLAGLEIVQTGSRFLNKRNTALAPAFADLSARLGYRGQRWEVRLEGRNLTDRRDPVAESELGDAQYYRLPARRFDLIGRWRF